jgi:synaptobrevin family protein YKT6
MTFTGGEIAQRTQPGKRQDVEENSRLFYWAPDWTHDWSIVPDHIFHVYAHSAGVCGVVITDLEYPKLVAHSLLSKVLDEFVSKYPQTAYKSFAKDSAKLAMPELKDYITKYQDPNQADSILKIQKELDETKITLHKTIESVLERGEKIDNLVAKSDGLSAQSKMFYTQVSHSSARIARVGRWPAQLGQEAKLVLHRHVDMHTSPPIIARRSPSGSHLRWAT